MATDFNKEGSGKFNSRNKFTGRSSNDSDNNSRFKGKPAKFNNEGKKVFNRSERFDRNTDSSGERRPYGDRPDRSGPREPYQNRGNQDNKRFGGFKSNEKFKKSGPFSGKSNFSREEDVAPKRSMRFDESGENNREDYRPARPYNANRNFNTENRFRKSPFGDVPKGKAGERNRSFKPEKEAYRQKLREEGNSPEDRFNKDYKPYNRSRVEGDSEQRPVNRFNRDTPNADQKPFDRNRSDDRRPYGGNREQASNRKPYDHNRSEGSNDRKPFNRSRENDNSDRSSFQRPRDNNRPRRDDFAKKSFPRRDNEHNNRQSFRRNEEGPREAPDYDLRRYGSRDRAKSNTENQEDTGIRLNRYIANAGVCSRREADTLIAAGEIKVNGEVITEMGYVVKPEDTVQYGKKRLNREKMVYVILNKPKDFITTTEDPEGRKTVMDLVANASKERIFPVGRLDRNTTGLLLFTNDGELAQKLTHPSHKNSKIYQVELDKPLTRTDFEKIQAGLELEDGKAEVDDLAMIGDTGKFVGIEIHIGKNRIVRRIFEHLGYEVVSLDRVQYAGLTKKDLPRGKWRFLNEKEVIRLKYFL
ncbi:pseudouridine synthase [Adhaeribacter pallidiroseus]|uniref:Pseudouridine synthase n=1 Tax=Adhaeribacter pallidiroseus TaxID=2072847 RepID=A0A369QNF4_9BACT|nr:pseudouridine synthase [Adhaeribacter pallidiroseus]RDC65900.1 23S rRNA pseudouridine(2605) synthase [Adhaeribacter pallidiroseus]